MKTSDWSLEYRKWELSHYTTEELVEEVNRRTEVQIAKEDASFQRSMDLLDDSIKRLDSLTLDLGEGFGEVKERPDD